MVWIGDNVTLLVLSLTYIREQKNVLLSRIVVLCHLFQIKTNSASHLIIRVQSGRRRGIYRIPAAGGSWI